MEVQKRSRKKVVKSLLFCLLILVAIDNILRVLDAEGVLWEPSEWGNRPEIATKLNKCMDLFNRNDAKFKIVFVGDSTTEIGIDPVLLDSFFNNETISYNFGIAGTSPRFQSVYFEKVILPKLKPDFVIWSVNPSDFWDSIPTNEFDNAILRTPMGRYYTGDGSGLDFFGQVNQFLFQNSPLYRYRGYFVPPWLDFSIYRGLIANPYTNGYWTTDIKAYSSNDTTILNIPGILPSWEGYPVSFNNLSADRMVETLNLIQTNGLDYLVVYGPFNHFNYTFPELDYVLGSLTQERFLDLNGNETLMWDDLYNTIHHLNKDGAQILTRFIYEKLADRIESVLTN